MNIYKQYAPIYRNATVLLRPRTPLKDMYLALDPGDTACRRGPGRRDARASASTSPTSTSTRSCPRSTPTRATTCCCCWPAAPRRSRIKPRLRTQRRTSPTGPPRPRCRASRRCRPARHVQAVRAARPRHARRSPPCSPQRSANLRLAIHNLNLVATALGGVDGQLASLINSSNTNFAAISSQDANLESALSLLPGTLSQTNTDARQGAGRSRAELGPALSQLVPFARALGPALKASRPLFHDTTPVIQTSCGRSRSPCSRWRSALRRRRRSWRRRRRR